MRPSGAWDEWGVHACAQGTIPASWGSGAAFPKMRNLTLANNALISGTLPAVRAQPPYISFIEDKAPIVDRAGNKAT